jgi:hypothetical protein
MAVLRSCGSGRMERRSIVGCKIRDACPYKTVVGHFDDPAEAHFVFGVLKWFTK